MKTRTLGILTLVAATLLVIAVTVYTRFSTQFDPNVPVALNPTLESRIGDIAHVHVKGPKGEFHINLIDGVWRMREKGDYPIRTPVIRQAILTVSDLTVVDRMTSKPENYPLLGVQDPQEGSSSILFEMTDANDEPIASIVLGGVERGINTLHRYVRLTDDPRVFYIEGIAAVETDPMRWINKEIFRVPRAYTHEIVIRHPDGEVVRIERTGLDTKDFILDNIPPGYELNDPRDINIMGSSFLYVGLDDVAPIKDTSEIKPGIVAYSRTFDGFIMTAHLFDLDDATWAWFEASSEKPMIDVDAQSDDSAEENAYNVPLRPLGDVLAKVDEYNSKLKNWRFKLSESKTTQWSKRMSDLITKSDDESSPGADVQAGPPAPAPG